MEDPDNLLDDTGPNIYDNFDFDFDFENLDNNSEPEDEADLDIEYDDDEIWEAPMPNPGAAPSNLQPTATQSNAGRQNIENQLRQKVFTTKFSDVYPDSGAGNPISHSPDHIPYSNSNPNIYAPFKDKLNWEIARWAKLRGPGSTALSELLSTPGVGQLFMFFCYQFADFLIGSRSSRIGIQKFYRAKQNH